MVDSYFLPENPVSDTRTGAQGYKIINAAKTGAIINKSLILSNTNIRKKYLNEA